jgi:riboflavin kinase / FMN adenylyltransferase
MAIFTYALDAPMPDACRGGAFTIGNFDGVHLGHQTLLAEAIRQARPAVAVTFDPHPIQILRPNLVQPFLSTLADRVALLQGYGVDHVLVIRTSPALLQLPARTFFEQLIVAGWQAQALVEGYSFGFGRNREGTIDLLKLLCAEKNVRLTLIPPQEVSGQRISSSRVRNELLAGRADIARQMLGRPYRITGVVGAGAKRGATLGFPTANLEQVATLIPGDGVYAAQTTIDGKKWSAAVNVGPNPTFDEHARKVEAHLIGFAGQLYGQSLRLDFIQRVRDTRPFGSVQELVAQINADIVEVKRLIPCDSSCGS